MTDIDTSPDAVERLAQRLAEEGWRRAPALLRQLAKERDEALGRVKGFANGNNDWRIAYNKLALERDEAIALATEVADDLEALVEDQYKDTKHYPSELRRYERDIDPVRRVRALKTTT